MLLLLNDIFTFVLIFKRTLSRVSIAVPHNMFSKRKRTYQDAIEALNNLQTNSQYLKNSLTRPKAETNIAEVTKFLKRANLPLEKLDSLSVIHVAGTNGKGTTCAYCERILRNHGYKTGFYSSPHLLDVRERIRIDGKPISKTEFALHFWRVYDLLDKEKAGPADMPLYFRYLTILAFHIFIEHAVDVAIVEVGIGGEYDCTNVIRNTVVAGITPLDLDHTSLLGHSIESIAWNKGGIMKESSIAFTAEQPDRAMKVLVERSIEKQCTLNVIENNLYVANNNCKIPLHVQRTNASLALAISEAFIKKKTANGNKLSKDFSLELAKKSIEETNWPGRYAVKQLNRLRFFLDGAHTIESMTVCANWFREKTVNSTRNKALIFNLTGDRNPTKFFKELRKLKFDFIIFTPNVGSDKDPADTTDFVQNVGTQLKNCEDYKKKWAEVEDAGIKTGDIQIFPSVSKAVTYLDGRNDCDVLITGSIHLIGAALSVLDPTLDGTLSE